jgi:hypothetical protein
VKPLSHPRRIAGIALVSLAIAVPVTAADTPMWQAGAGFFISSGDYGTDSDITTTYLPFSFGRVFSHGKLDLVLPFISVTSEDSVTVVGGKVQRRQRVTGRSERQTESGLGDMLLRGRWQALEEQGAWTPGGTGRVDAGHNTHGKNQIAHRGQRQGSWHRRI